MPNSDRNPIGVDGRNEAQVSASQERLMGIIGSATDAIITVDDEQRVTLFNAAAERMFRCPAAEAIGQALSRFIPDRFRDIHREHIRVFGETGVTTRAMASQRPLMALRADGVEFPVEATISQSGVAGQKLFTAIVRDVSERKRAEEALRESEGRYRALFEYAPDGILIADSRSNYVDANPSICRMLGYTREELIGLHATNIVAQSEVPHIGEALEKLNARSDYEREWQFRRKDGSIFAAEVIATRMPDGNLMGMIRDITERKRAEEALRESEGRLRAIVETAVDGIITIDERGNVTSFNPAAVRLFGYAPEEVAGRNVNRLMPAPYHDEHDEYLANYRNTGVKKIIGIGREVVGRRKDGTLFPMDLAVSETRLADRRIFTGIVRNISERKQAEEALSRQAEELARSNVELERFAYVASHDLQEPMRTVQSFAQLLQRNCAQSLKGEAGEYLGFIIGGVQRMQTLINDLLAYSRVSSQGAAFAPADCKEICARVLENLKASIETHQAEVIVDPLPVVIGDATQLGQVFQNLLVNAIKFHGRRTPRIHVSVKETPREWIFSIVDNGIGIKAEYFERIFIIFQRLHTIEEYGGTGIGLAICKKIAERHGGRIWVESVVGEGSTFHFLIPKREKAI